MPGRALVLVENLSVPLDRRVWQECRSLTNAGWRMSVICPQGGTYDREPYVELEGVQIHRYPLRAATGGPLGYVREYGTALRKTRAIARRLARERAFDVVHACNPPDLLLPAVRSLKRAGTAFLFDHHDLVPELYLSRFGRGEDVLYRATLAVERRTFRLADVVVSTNESYRRVALGRGRKREEDVFVVRSAPDLGRFTLVEPDPSLRQGKDYLIVYLGVMGPQDGVDHALRALALVARRRGDWHAVFVGSGDVADDMRALAIELGIGEKVDFPGRLSDGDVRRVLSSADVCLAPDPKNALNDVSTMNKIVEYMAMSRPFVSYDLVESRVSAGDAAVYARANDVEDFARGVELLLDDPERRLEMGRLGRRRVETELSWKLSERALLAAYERAVAKRR